MHIARSRQGVAAAVHNGLRRVGAVIQAMTGGGEDISPPASRAIAHAADAVLVRQGIFHFRVVKDRYGMAGADLSPLGVVFFRGRRRIVILDGVDRIVSRT